MNLLNELIIERKGSGGQFSSLYAPFVSSSPDARLRLASVQLVRYLGSV